MLNRRPYFVDVGGYSKCPFLVSLPKIKVEFPLIESKEYLRGFVRKLNVRIILPRPKTINCYPGNTTYKQCANNLEQAAIFQNVRIESTEFVVVVHIRGHWNGF